MDAHKEFIPTRRSLLNRLKNWSDDESWKSFFDTYWRLIYSVAAKAGLADPEAQDVVQEVVLAVAKKMPDFNYDPEIGSFKGWLLLITRRRIADHLRQQYRQPPKAEPLANPRTETGTAARQFGAAPADFDRLWDHEWEQHLLATALRRVKREVSPKHYQIFDFCALKQWPAAKVAHVLEVSLPQVYLAKHRVARLVRAEVKQLHRKLA